MNSRKNRIIDSSKYILFSTIQKRKLNRRGKCGKKGTSTFLLFYDSNMVQEGGTL